MMLNVSTEMTTAADLQSTQYRLRKVRRLLQIFLHDFKEYLMYLKILREDINNLDRVWG